MNKESPFLQALNCRNTERAPVWIMRQAGRYMPSYRKLREKHSLMEMFHHEELITEVTLLPIKELDLDAAIIFSDILLPLESLGFSLTYQNFKGPEVLPKTLLSVKTLCPSLEELQTQFGFLTKSIEHLTKELKVPLIGFCGAPFTLASYVLESDSHHLMKKTKNSLYQNPKEFHGFLELLTNLMINYAKMQVLAGAQVIQIFDSWAGVLDQEQFNSCSAYYMKKMIKALKADNIPVIVFCRGSCQFVEELVEIEPTAISFDWHRPIAEMAKKVPSRIALQGNLDPDLLRAPHTVIKEKTKFLLESMKGEKRFIANLGHGILPDLSQDAVKCFVDTVKSF